MLELGREWVSEEIYLRLDFILFQSRLKKRFEDRRFRNGGHITQKELAVFEEGMVRAQSEGDGDGRRTASGSDIDIR